MSNFYLVNSVNYQRSTIFDSRLTAIIHSTFGILIPLCLPLVVYKILKKRDVLQLPKAHFILHLNMKKRIFGKFVCRFISNYKAQVHQDVATAYSLSDLDPVKNLLQLQLHPPAI